MNSFHSLFDFWFMIDSNYTYTHFYYYINICSILCHKSLVIYRLFHKLYTSQRTFKKPLTLLNPKTNNQKKIINIVNIAVSHFHPFCHKYTQTIFYCAWFNVWYKSLCWFNQTSFIFQFWILFVIIIQQCMIYSENNKCMLWCWSKQSKGKQRK